jgi:cytochrome c oxidase assembly factor CtaG
MSHSRPSVRPRRPVAVAAGLAAWLAAAATALAHGGLGLPEPSAWSFLVDWSFEPLLQFPLLLSAVLYLEGVRRVAERHPMSPVPRRRVIAFLAGLFAIEVALQSGIEAYDTTLFSVHMVQHVLLTLVAAPLLVLGAPITLLLRVISHEQRRRYVLPILHGRIVRLLTHPVVAWLVFSAVMWGTHFSPLFDASLEDPLVHDLEHLLYLASALLFWWPAIGSDPAPWRMAHPARILYLFLQMPQNTFLALAIFSAGAPLYPHYATVARAWGPSVLADQQGAGAIMWVAGDLVFLAAMLGVVLAWMHDEERREGRRAAQVTAARAAIRAREIELAERLAGDGQAGSGAER